MGKTGQDKDISYVKNLFAFAEKQKHNIENDFDVGRDKMIIVFDGDIFEDKVLGYEDLVKEIESKDDVVAVTNPNFELFLLLHIADSFNKHIKGRERDFLTKDEKGRFSYAATVLRQLTNMNSKTNSKIGELAENIFIAIEQEKHVNQDIHQIRGKVSSNIAKIIEEIIKENPTV